MRMAFKGLTSLSESFKFIADGYSAYPLAAQQFHLKDKDPLDFDITQVIGLTNDDEVSTQFRPFKQVVERLNRTYKESYRCTCGYKTSMAPTILLLCGLPITTFFVNIQPSTTPF